MARDDNHWSQSYCGYFVCTDSRVKRRNADSLTQGQLGWWPRSHLPEGSTSQVNCLRHSLIDLLRREVLLREGGTSPPSGALIALRNQPDLSSNINFRALKLLEGQDQEASQETVQGKSTSRKIQRSARNSI